MKNLIPSSTALMSFFLLSFILLLSLPALGQAGGVLDQLKNCARTANADVRAQCYEDLGKQVLNADADSGSDSSNKAATIVPAVATLEPGPAEQTATHSDSANPLPDTVGGGKFNKGADVHVESYTAELTRCQRASDRKWFYIFANGQIWKQVDKRKLRHSDCGGTVTIVKDGFGYKMQVAEIKGQVRIRRYK